MYIPFGEKRACQFLDIDGCSCKRACFEGMMWPEINHSPDSLLRDETHPLRLGYSKLELCAMLYTHPQVSVALYFDPFCKYFRCCPEA